MKHRTPVLATLAAAALAGFVPIADAQVREIPAFFGGGNQAAFDPEIDIVESGAKLDVQATVSADRKYVTMTMRPQLANLVALREFTFQNGAQRGIVGLPNPVNPAPAPQNQDPAPDAAPNRRGPRARADKAPPATAPAAPQAAAPAPPAAPSVLEREGMFRIVLQPAR